MGVTSTVASITSTGAASASYTHLPVSAPLGAGPTAPAAPEEMVSAVHAGACAGRAFLTCLYIGCFEIRTYFLMEKNACMVSG